MRFNDWLKAERYRDTTIRGTHRGLERARQSYMRRIPENAHAAIATYLRWFDQYGGTAGKFETRLRVLGFTAATRGPRVARKRKREARSFETDDWVKLRELIMTDGNAASRVLAVLMGTSLRIRDVLAITRHQLSKGFKRGTFHIEVKGGRIVPKPLAGAEDAWNRLTPLLSTKYRNVAVWICPRGDGSPEAGQGAYKAVSRRLSVLAHQAEVRGRVHLQRLRRTLAVQALRATKDVGAVQQLLGHSHPATTHRYIDEAREEDVADLQRQLNKKD